jgi:hypothetical protein
VVFVGTRHGSINRPQRWRCVCSWSILSLWAWPTIFGMKDPESSSGWLLGDCFYRTQCWSILSLRAWPAIFGMKDPESSSGWLLGDCFYRTHLWLIYPVIAGLTRNLWYERPWNKFRVTSKMFRFVIVGLTRNLWYERPWIKFRVTIGWLFLSDALLMRPYVDGGIFVVVFVFVGTVQ